MKDDANIVELLSLLPPLLCTAESVESPSSQDLFTRYVSKLGILFKPKLREGHLAGLLHLGHHALDI